MPRGIYIRTTAHYSLERNAKISAKLLGKKKSKEHSKNIGLGHKGKVISDKHKQVLRQKSIERFKTDSNWGFKVGHGSLRNRITPKDRVSGNEYQKLHKWVRKNLGQPQKCQKCGLDGLTGRKINWASKSRLYKKDLTDWLRLCSKCHHNYDG